VRQAPPTFLLFINRDELFSDQYKKYLGNQLRRAFGYEGCPIVLVPKSRPRTVEPIRKFATPRQRSRTGPEKPAANAKQIASVKGAAMAGFKKPRFLMFLASGMPFLPQTVVL
jgi:hypothetical protein